MHSHKQRRCFSNWMRSQGEGNTNSFYAWLSFLRNKTNFIFLIFILFDIELLKNV